MVLADQFGTMSWLDRILDRNGDPRREDWLEAALDRFLEGAHVLDEAFLERPDVRPHLLAAAGGESLERAPLLAATRRWDGDTPTEVLDRDLRRLATSLGVGLWPAVPVPYGISPRR